MFGIKIILKSTIENKNDIFFEEIILTVKEQDVNLAFEKAEQYAKGYCEGYINAYGDKVNTEIYYISDAFEVFEEENGVREVYSKFMDIEGEDCSRKDLKSLNRWFNRLKDEE